MTLSNFDSVTPNEDVINLQAEYEKKFQKNQISRVCLQQQSLLFFYRSWSCKKQYIVRNMLNFADNLKFSPLFFVEFLER